MQLSGSVSCPPLHLSCSCEHPVVTQQESTGTLCSERANSNYTMLDPNSIHNGTVCSEQSQYQLKRFPTNQMPNLLSCHHPDSNAFLQPTRNFRPQWRDVLQDSPKQTKKASAFLLAGELPAALEGSWPFTAGFLESDGPGGDSGKQLKLVCVGVCFRSGSAEKPLWVSGGT